MIQGQISAWVAKVSEFSSYCGQFVRGVSGLDKRVRSNHHLVIKSFILSDYFFNSFEIQWLWSQGVDLDVWWYVRPCDHRLLVISKHRWKRTLATPWITFNISDQGRWNPCGSRLKLLFGKKLQIMSNLQHICHVNWINHRVDKIFELTTWRGVGQEAI